MNTLWPLEPSTAFTNLWSFETGSGIVFHHFLNDTFHERLGKGVIIYIDNILIYSDNTAEQQCLTIHVMEIICKASLYLKASGCEFNRTSMTFLGYVVASDGIKTNPAKVKAVSNFPTPQNLKQTRSFLGMVGYYR